MKEIDEYLDKDRTLSPEEKTLLLLNIQSKIEFYSEKIFELRQHFEAIKNSIEYESKKESI